MSCQIMRPEPLMALANAVAARLNYGFDYWGFGASQALHQAFSDCRAAMDTYYAVPVYKKLYALNIKAYEGRYKEKESDELPVDVPANMDKYILHEIDGSGKRKVTAPWHYRLAQLLDFWLYQTSEDMTKNDPLRLAVQEFRDGLYRFIVQHTPEYAKLPWSGWSSTPSTAPHPIDSACALSATITAVANHAVKYGCEHTTSGNMILCYDAFKDLITEDDYKRFYGLICDELRSREEVLDLIANIGLGALDLDFALAFCPSYEWAPGDESTFGCSREEWEKTPIKPVAQLTSPRIWAK